MKKRWVIYSKRIIAMASLFIISFSYLFITQNYVDSSTLRIEGFYQEEKNSLDVVMIGASDVHCGFSPGLAYGEYGFTSYLYTLDSNFIELYKYQINEVLSRQAPQCIMIETTGALYEMNDNNKDERSATLRKFVDNIPFSSNKIDTIERFVEEDKASYFLPWIVYHGQSDNFKRTYYRFSQKLRGTTMLKGIASSNTRQEYEDLFEAENDYTALPISSKAESNLIDFLDYCDTLSCKVIFTRFPHRITTQKELDELRKENYIEKIIKERGFDFLNFDHKISEIGLNYEDDYYSDSHLNVDGQIKLTRYFADILKNDYGVQPTELSDKSIDNWNKSYDYTKAFIQCYYLHNTDKDEIWWYETPELISELNNILGD